MCALWPAPGPQARLSGSQPALSPDSREFDALKKLQAIKEDLAALLCRFQRLRESGDGCLWLHPGYDKEL